MSTKLIAMGNILMKDDGIAVFLAGYLKDTLCDMGIEVISGETDIGYCITQIKEGDFLILMDAARTGKNPGEVTLLSFIEAATDKRNTTQHCISFLDIINLYFPKNDGVILTIEIAEICFYYGLSAQLQDKISIILQEILLHIRKIIEIRNELNANSLDRNQSDIKERSLEF